MFDRGSGNPIIVIPGLQGRWEWMAPALNALTRYGRVVSYTLGRVTTFEELLDQLDGVLDAKDLRTVSICGISYGGRVAAAYAATRSTRVARLVIASAPGPSFEPSERQAAYLSRPWRSTPAFIFGSPVRLWPEIAAALPSATSRIRFSLTHGWRMATAPILPASMAARMHLPMRLELRAACADIAAPTLVVTGAPGLDRVVPPDSTREYVSLIPGAKYEMMGDTGHLGLITQPERFARVVGTFVNAASS
jgi:pimeloyl-ACP methyl ester carboxylesterase